MARSIRIEYAGAYYHVMARGNRREAIFKDDDDRLFFLKTLGEACGMTGWKVHAWVLMSNHYHLLIETPEPNLVKGMQWLQNAYTRRHNTRHGLWGRLFGDRYKAVVVEGKSAYYYETLVDYIHLNPARSGLVGLKKAESVSDYPWSSLAGGYLLPPRQRPEWLAAERGLKLFGFEDTTAGRRKFLARLDRRAREESREGREIGVPEKSGDGRESHLKRGWHWGTREFADKVLELGQTALKKERGRTYRSSREQRSHGEKEAERLLKEGLAAAGLTGKELEKLKGSDPRKVAIATVIWERTTVGMKWLAEHLEMKSPANASQQIKRGVEGKRLPEELRDWENLSRNVA